MNRGISLAVSVVVLAAADHAAPVAAQDSFAGQWMLSIDQGRGEMLGLLGQRSQSLGQRVALVC